MTPRDSLDKLLMPVEASGVLDIGSAGDDSASESGTVVCRGGSGPPEWMRSDTARVFASPGRSEGGTEVQRLSLEGGETRSIRFESDTRRVAVPFSFDEAYQAFARESWTQTASASRLSARQLAAYYRVKRFIPRRAQLAARRALIRRQGAPDFPQWPFDASVASLLRLYVRCLLLARGQTSLEFRWFWPADARLCLTLTHDVESQAGLRAAIDLAAIEEERGFRSSFNVVASGYPIDRGILEELKQRGFEIGVHGVFHDRSMFSSRSSFESQQARVREAVAEFGAAGFRSPATHRVHEWLGELPVDYDCSVPMSDPYEPQPGGCCSPWPYFLGRVVELPYTLPQDHTLFTLLGHHNIDLWLRQVEDLAGVSGLVQCLTHPDPGYLGDPPKRRLYVEFLDALSQRKDLWKALPRDVASWWRLRSQPGPLPPSVGIGVATADEATGAVTFAPAPGHE